MSDQQFLELTRNWALAFDVRQWVVQERHGLNKDGSEHWRGRKFVASSRADLLRCLDELGLVPTPEGKAALDQLPETFGAFLAQQGVDRPSEDMRSLGYRRPRPSKQKHHAPAPRNRRACASR